MGMIGMVADRWTAAETAYVRVVGPLRHVRLADLRARLAPHLRGYWRTDLAAAAAAARTLPWVAAARAERVWPDTLELWLQEQRPVFRWGTDALLNERGEKFTPARIGPYAGLPQLVGPAGYEARLFAAFREMAAALAPLGWHPVRLVVDARHSWRLETREGTTLMLGRDRPRAAFARLVAALRQLAPGVRRRIEYVDARYDHGFALRLREAGEESATRTQHTQAQHG